MSRSKLDPNHIFQSVYDCESNSFKSKLVDTDFSIELNHEDGDSVKALGEVLISAAALQINISAFRNARLYVDSGQTVTLSISPDGLKYYSVGTRSSEGVTLIENLCALYAKVEGTGKVGFGS